MGRRSKHESPRGARRARAVPRALALGITAGHCAVLGAAEAHSALMVRASVAPVASLEPLSDSPLLSVSALDIERGYVDVGTPMGIRIRSNSPEGYALEVLPLSPLFSTVSIRGLGSEVSLEQDGGTIVQRWQHGGSVSLALTYRFHLRPGVQPGEYPWPLRLRVRALGTAAQ